ncbi:hypothetical protein CAOG_07559 [Capsaspora owczarzaki ATCC 30864]|uniref:Uncharacterized protein n=1 Tax=Capsaspora owczarzaki (strain ATCC 30864) TaxID=595528 RepID=A0A0D2WWV5_CAPO3|nr:hypothetical protein CAOG_07559 [Capsaspora owczarzaki ATCC 30864]KJE97088.1 hypothetical protein CAOG_007559 [Capsaspora owczarzaki ATCC 30864]|eukprot:XP_004343433.1 hypothetical protein CAOG_07559 [Capsaspora owczarzaki ATCC 30864]
MEASSPPPAATTAPGHPDDTNEANNNATSTSGSPAAGPPPAAVIDLAALDNRQLFKLMSDLGLSASPITKQTRMFAERKVRDRLQATSGSAAAIVVSSSPTANPVQVQQAPGDPVPVQEPSVQDAAPGRITEPIPGCQTYYAVVVRDTVPGESAPPVINLVRSGVYSAIPKKGPGMPQELLKSLQFDKFRDFDAAARYVQEAIVSAGQAGTGTARPTGSALSATTAAVAAENVSQYRTPEASTLGRFAREIEQGNLESVQKQINDNPKFLVDSSNRPMLLAVQDRSTALHVAAQHNRRDICQFIVGRLKSDDFWTVLFPSGHDKHEALLDHVNARDRLMETPLHRACKWGSKSVVAYLLSLDDLTDRSAANEDGKTAEEIICTRDNSAQARNIKDLFVGQYYIPLYRTDDASAPVVGLPFSSPVRPDTRNAAAVSLERILPPEELAHTKSLAFQASAGGHEAWLSASSPSGVLRRTESTQGRLPEWSPLMDRDLHSPRSNAAALPTGHGTHKLCATAGPMTERQAQEFREKWSPLAGRTHSNIESPKKQHTPMLRQHHGLLQGNGGRLGSPAAAETSAPGSHIASPFSTPTKSASLAASQFTSPSLSPFSSHPRRQTDTQRLQNAEKGFEVIGRRLSTEFHTPWQEHWAFLRTSCNAEDPEAHELFEKYLAERPNHLFINGPAFRKDDRDFFEAMGDHIPNSTKFPLVSKWYHRTEAEIQNRANQRSRLSTPVSTPTRPAVEGMQTLSNAMAQLTLKPGQGLDFDR